MKHFLLFSAERGIFRAALITASMFAFGAAVNVANAGTSDSFKTNGDLTVATGYNSQMVPGNTTDVTLTTTTNALTISAYALTMESLTNATGNDYTITNATTGSMTSTLTLGSGSTFTNSNDSTANDLIALTNKGNLTITGANSNTGTGTLGVVLASSGNFNVNSSASLAISANISETGGPRTLTFTGNTSGNTTLSGMNTFSGGLVAAGGEVDVTSDANLGAAGGSVTINGGRLGIATNNFTVDSTRKVYLGANPTGGNTTGTLSIKGSITTTFNQGFQDLSGSVGDLVKQGGGTLQMGGVSTYSGNTYLNNGITQLIGSGNLPTGTTLNLGQSNTNNGELDLNGINQQLAGLVSVLGTNKGTSNMSPALNTNTVTTSTGTSSLTLGGTDTYVYGSATPQNSGTISGAISIAKTGTGTQTFGAANTYTGNTAVTGGTLLVTNTSGSGTGTGSVTVDGTSSLLGGTGTITGIITVGSAGKGGTISAGAGTPTTVTTLTTGALTLASTSTFNAIIAGNKAYGTLSAFGTTNVSNAAFTITVPAGTVLTSRETLTLITSPVNGHFTDSSFTAGGYNFAADYLANGDFGVDITAVPEPATILGGLLMIGAFCWHQRRQLRGLASAMAGARLG
jgi:autotransporter-associated beta strand protein